ncbi:MAG: DNA-binding transcriptional LysR family regulator, partial [Oleiphilaceae bacterium]
HVIALGSTTGLWDLLFQDTLHKVHKNSPELALRAESHGPETLIRHMMERTLDLALIYEPAKLNDLVSIPIAPAELILVSSKEDATVDSAMASGYVAVDWGLSFQMSYAQLFPDAASPVLHTTLSRIALDFILVFGGSAYLPYRMVENDVGNNLYQVNEAPVITRQIYACYHKESLYTKDIEEILNVIRSLEVPVENVPESIEV